MHALIGTELSRAREHDLVERGRRERHVGRLRRASTRRPARAVGED
jgi:hypothetical protein